MLIAARSSKDLACCVCATVSARSKYSTAFARFGYRDLSEISPATRLTSLSHHLSLAVSTAVIASPMQRHASSDWPSAKWALARYVNNSGIHIVDPVDRNAASPVVIAGIASEALPVTVKRQPRHSNPDAFHNEAS